jgi:lipopolysaccharide/colanic/teichoic acid biosynthesis glycosyltransferase
MSTEDSKTTQRGGTGDGRSRGRTIQRSVLPGVQEGRTQAIHQGIVQDLSRTCIGGGRPAPADNRDSATGPVPVARGLVYCRGRLKRGFDIGFSLLALVLLLPLLILIALLILLTSDGPALFTQERVGLSGRLFRLWKFRSMRVGADQGSLITSRGDNRITPVGRFLRATKLDELPQFVNVLRGDMSLVGPRPLIGSYYMSYTPEQRRVLEARPGLTDPATLLFMDEETLLARVSESQREIFYREEILQKKLELNLSYIERASLLYDLRLILKTAILLLSPAQKLAARRTVSPRIPEA